MTLVRYNPLDEFVPTSWNSILDSFFTGEEKSSVRQFSPKVDIAENKDNFEIHLAVPGMKKDDFNVEIKDKTLTISGERKWNDEQKDKNFHRVETQYGSFRRSFNLPDNVNTEKIVASYNDGILEIDIPKDAKKELVTTIKIK
ncbi:MAG: Hsp20/alpha crystallin family protein [Cyclobacteriaceae bacterium]|nr:Hsp20/alpha crystallin family protein [Cyclobacteriaceae bacterium]